MVNFYVNRIKRGKMTIEEVPERWREEVRKALESDNIVVNRLSTPPTLS